MSAIKLVLKFYSVLFLSKLEVKFLLMKLTIQSSDISIFLGITYILPIPNSPFSLMPYILNTVSSYMYLYFELVFINKLSKGLSIFLKYHLHSKDTLGAKLMLHSHMIQLYFH